MQKGYASDSIHWEEVFEQGSATSKMMVNALLRRAWIILTVYTVAYPSEK